MAKEESRTDIDVRFVGSKQMQATINDDISVLLGGGQATAYDLFLVGLAACSAANVRGFCVRHDIPLEQVSLQQSIKYDDDNRRLAEVNQVIVLSPDIPENIAEAIIRAAGQCGVKRAMFDPPKVTTVVERTE